MLFLEMLEIAFLICVAIGILTQIIMPILKSENLFPMFRPSRKAQLEQELAEARREMEESRLQRELYELRAKSLDHRLANHDVLQRAADFAVNGELPLPQTADPEGPAGKKAAK